MCYSDVVKELYVCGCLGAPARCGAAKLRFRTATTFEGKLLAICPGGSGSADRAMVTRDLCAWCWEGRRLPRLRGWAGRGEGNGNGGGAGAAAGQDNGKGEKEEGTKRRVTV